MNKNEKAFNSDCLRLSTLFKIYDSHNYIPDQNSALVLIYNIKGTAHIKIAGKQCSLTPGSFLLSQHREEHQVIIGNSRSQCCIAEFVSDSKGINLDVLMLAAGYSSLALKFQGSNAFIRIDIEENRVLLTLEELANELANNESRNHKIIDSLFEVLLIKLERSVQFHGRASGFSFVAQAKQYIIENLASNITVQSIADYVGIHRTYLMRIFRQQTHYSVKMYINRMRISQATTLLSGSDLSVTEIAFLVGFNSRQNFYIMFEKLHGCSPSRYREGTRNISSSIP